MIARRPGQLPRVSGDRWACSSEPRFFGEGIRDVATAATGRGLTRWTLRNSLLHSNLTPHPASGILHPPCHPPWRRTAVKVKTEWMFIFTTCWNCPPKAALFPARRRTIGRGGLAFRPGRERIATLCPTDDRWKRPPPRRPLVLFELSPPMLRALEQAAYTEPTPVQSRVDSPGHGGSGRDGPGPDWHRQDGRLRHPHPGTVGACEHKSPIRRPWYWCPPASWPCRSGTRLPSWPHGSSGAHCGPVRRQAIAEADASISRMAPTWWWARPAGCWTTSVRGL